MREKIKLESTAGTGHFYTTTKNKKTTPEKMEIKKYDPVARKHVAYKEIKLRLACLFLDEKPRLERGFFHVRSMGAIGSATSEVRKGVRNTLYVHSTPSLASLWLMPRLGQFVQAFPDISLSLSASPAHSDFALGQVDVDIRYGVPEWPNLVVEPIAEERILPLASPDLLARLPVRAPSDLFERPLIQSMVSVVQWPA